MYELIPTEAVTEVEATSFVGGHPHLPSTLALPTCAKCGKPLTFFYQVAFPEAHPWATRSLAVFACTSTWHPDDLIPPLLPQLRDVIVPEDFLNAYQTTFRLLVFPTRTALLREDYVPSIKFMAWRLDQARNVAVTKSKVGGEPTWRMRRENPASYTERPLTFLMQLAGHFAFERLQGAPTMARDPQFDRLLPPSPRYDLFVGNVLYLWGTNDDGPEAVCALVQRP